MMLKTPEAENLLSGDKNYNKINFTDNKQLNE